MKSSLRFQLTVFVMLVTLLNSQYAGKTGYRNLQVQKFQQPYEYKKVYSNQDKIKIGSIQDVSLIQKVPFTFQVNETKDHSKIYIYEQVKTSFVIDARSFSSSPFVNEQKINVVIRLANRQQSDSIERIIKRVQIEKDQWNSDKGQFLSTVFNIDQLTMQRHNQFYSILLPTLSKGKYKVTLTDIEKVSKPVKLQIVYFKINLSGINKNLQSSGLPITIDTSTQSSVILPYGQTLRIPISSPQQNMILSVQSCSFQSPQIYYSQNDPNSENMFLLRDHNQQENIFLMKNPQYPSRSNIYFKSIYSTQLYFNVRYVKDPQKNFNGQQNFNQYLLKVHKNPVQLFKRDLRFSQKIQSPISYLIKGNDIEITYKKVYPDQKSLLEYDKSKLNNTKIVYKIYASPSQSALAKRSLCELRSYQNGQQIVVFQKIIQQQSLHDIVQNLKEKNKQRQRIQKEGTTKISLLELKKQFQKIGPQLYLNMKVYLLNQDTLISSGQTNSQHLKAGNNQETFHFQAIKIDLLQESWLFFEDIKFWKLMWGFIILCFLVFFTLFLIETALRSWKKRMIKQIIQDEMRSPRIIISKPKIVEMPDKSLADSYGFYPSPPSSSSNIIQAYGFGSDLIIEDQQSKQKSSRKGQIMYQPLSPTYF